MTKEKLREMLGVPHDLRIAQYLYNMFRDKEQSLEIVYRIKKGGEAKIVEQDVLGIDFFYVSDAEFIKRLKKGLDEK